MKTNPAATMTGAGALVVVGSLLPWAIGDVLNSGAAFIGVEIVEGVATFFMGLGIGLTGLIVLGSRGRPWSRLVVTVLAILCLAIDAYVFVTLAERLEGWDRLSLGGGLYAVAIGSVLALVGVFRMKSPTPRRST